MKTYRITVNGSAYDVTVEETPSNQSQIRPQNIPPAAVTAAPSAPAAPAAVPPAAAPPSEPTKAAPVPQTAGGIKVESPLPGSIYKVLVKPGDAIKKGQVIFIIEAMKMENEVVSPSDGTAATVNVIAGSAINTGDLLMTIN